MAEYQPRSYTDLLLSYSQMRERKQQQKQKTKKTKTTRNIKCTIYKSISLSLSLYIYTYIYKCICLRSTRMLLLVQLISQHSLRSRAASAPVIIHCVRMAIYIETVSTTEFAPPRQPKMHANLYVRNPTCSQAKKTVRGKSAVFQT